MNSAANQVSEVVKFTHGGHFVAEFEADPAASRDSPRESGFIFATVDDNATPPVLNIWVVK